MPKVESECRASLDPTVLVGDGPDIVLGYADHVNGPEAELVEEFSPSRYELRLLYRHWFEVAMEIRYGWFLFDQVGSTDRREHALAESRSRRIEALLGMGVCLAVQVEVLAALFKTAGSCGPDLTALRAFLSSDPAGPYEIRDGQVVGPRDEDGLVRFRSQDEQVGLFLRQELRLAEAMVELVLVEVERQQVQRRRSEPGTKERDQQLREEERLRRRIAAGIGRLGSGLEEEPQ